MDWVLWKGAHGFHQLLALPSDGNVQPGQSLCHGPLALLWPQKHLLPSHVSRRAASVRVAPVHPEVLVQSRSVSPGLRPICRLRPLTESRVTWKWREP